MGVGVGGGGREERDGGGKKGLRGQEEEMEKFGEEIMSVNVANLLSKSLYKATPN